MPVRPLIIPNHKRLDHQEALYEKNRDDRYFWIQWEMGLGKSKELIDQCLWLWHTDQIDAVIVVAPPGIDMNWVLEELPFHVSQSSPVAKMCWYTHASKTKLQLTREKAALELDANDKLMFLCISYPALCTDAGKKFVKKFITSRRCLLAADESHRLKNPTSMTCKVMKAAGQYATHRRALTGTPITNGPFDAFAQMDFLCPDFWMQFQINDFRLFKNYFGDYETRYIQRDGKTQSYQHLKGYKNIEKLTGWIRPHVSRLMKQEVLNLPPKLNQRVFYTLSGKHKKAYEELERHCLTIIGGEVEYTQTDADLFSSLTDDQMTSLEDAGNEPQVVIAQLAIVKMLRMQQVLCGFVACNKEEPEIDIDPKENPRLDILMDLLEDIPGQAMICCRFRRDIDLICERLKSRCVRYDGSVDPQGKKDALDAMKQGKAQFFVVSNSCSEGYTLLCCTTVIHYSNDFRLMNRLQMDDRPHRIGQTNPVTYIDIVCESTLDEVICERLIEKKDLAAEINGDTLRLWIMEAKSKNSDMVS